MPVSKDIGIARTVADLRHMIAAWRSSGETVGLVPTMGAIHAGHLALVNAAQSQCHRCVASLFVNPKQFGPKEDFAAYPRSEGRDVAAFAERGVDLVFIPAVDAMYPSGFATTVSVGAVTDDLEGAFRPGHFEGVATVVTKLLLQALPDAAYFGEKDFQQLTVVRHFVRDLDIPVRIEGVATLREPDGLALSSRNVYLSPEERRIAPRLHQVMSACATELRAAPHALVAVLENGRTQLGEAGFRVDYLELRAADDFAPLEQLSRPSRLLAAAYLGRTRLIDNIPVVPG
ncbi:MAG: pantoate--beta-alanine ligase [Alphaproteobacteria bacterium]|nr:pantoate--beta-alanine ligase [Alphaproteobacteria bacterium]